MCGDLGHKARRTMAPGALLTGIADDNDRARGVPDHVPADVPEEHLSESSTRSFPDDYGSRVALARDSHDRVRDRDFGILRHDQPLGVKAGVAGDRRALLCQSLSALGCGLVDLERRPDVERSGREAGHRRKLEQLETESGLPDHEDQGAALCEHASRGGERMLGGGRTVVGEDDQARLPRLRELL